MVTGAWETVKQSGRVCLGMGATLDRTAREDLTKVVTTNDKKGPILLRPRKEHVKQKAPEKALGRA